MDNAYTHRISGTYGASDRGCGEATKVAKPVAVAEPETRQWPSRNITFETNVCLDQKTGLETNVLADTTNLPPKLESACNETNSQTEFTKGLFSALKQ